MGSEKWGPAHSQLVQDQSSLDEKKDPERWSKKSRGGYNAEIRHDKHNCNPISCIDILSDLNVGMLVPTIFLSSIMGQGWGPHEVPGLMKFFRTGPKTWTTFAPKPYYMQHTCRGSAPSCQVMKNDSLHVSFCSVRFCRLFGIFRNQLLCTQFTCISKYK